MAAHGQRFIVAASASAILKPLIDFNYSDVFSLLWCSLLLSCPRRAAANAYGFRVWLQPSTDDAYVLDYIRSSTRQQQNCLHFHSLDTHTHTPNTFNSISAPLVTGDWSGGCWWRWCWWMCVCESLSMRVCVHLCTVMPSSPYSIRTQSAHNQIFNAFAMAPSFVCIESQRALSGACT